MDIFSGALGAVIAVLLLTSFVKLLTALNILRYGVGLRDATFSIVIIAVSLALTAIIFSAKIDQAGGVEAILKGSNQPPAIEKNFRPFLEQQTDPSLLKRMQSAALRLQKKEETTSVIPKASTPSFPVLLASFIISELRNAFALGLMFLIPFVVIDIAVANAVAALGLNQLSPAVVSLPLKLLMFIAVDGWTLVAEKLLKTYML